MESQLKPLQIGLIGCGAMGKAHADCLINLKSVRLIACSDVNRDRLVSFQKAYQIPKGYHDALELIADPDCQVCYILTPTFSHRSLCEAACRVDKILFIEKPLAVQLDDAIAIAKAVKDQRVRNMVGFKFRYYKSISRARQLVARPFQVHVHVIDDPWPPDFWANDPEKGGGNVVSQGIHGADLLRFLAASMPVQVFAAGANYHQPTGVVDNLSATFVFENGCAGSLVIGDCGQPSFTSKFSVIMQGIEGTVEMTERLTRLGFSPRNTGREPEMWSDTEDGFMNENEHFIHSLVHHQPVSSDIDDGVIAQAMIHYAIRSAKTGQIQSIRID